jgi:iron(III) transport system permease protein
LITGGDVEIFNQSILQLISPATILLLTRSIFLSSLSVLIAMFIAYYAGTWIWMRNGTVLSSVRWLVIMLIPVPAYIFALNVSYVLSYTPSLIKVSWGVLSPIQGWTISILVQAIAFLPLATGIVILSLDLLDSSIIDSARMFQSDRCILRRVILPLISPFLLCGAGILFVLSITEYTIPSLFSVTVYSMGIFAAYSATNDPASSLILSLPILGITVFLISWSASQLKNTFQNFALHSYTPVSRFILPLQVRLVYLVCFLVLLIEGFFVIGILVWQAMTGRGALQSLLISSGDILYTLQIGIIVAVVSLPLALIFATKLYKREKIGIYWILILIPLAIPAPLTGIGLISVMQCLNISLLSDSAFFPALASITRFIPFAALILFACMKQINPDILHAGQVFGKNLWIIINRIYLPLLIPGLLAAAGVMLVFSVGELGATLLVLPPGSSTITIRVYNYLHYGGSASVAALCLVTISIIMMVVTTVIVLLKREKEKLYPGKR